MFLPKEKGEKGEEGSKTKKQNAKIGNENENWNIFWQKIYWQKYEQKNMGKKIHLRTGFISLNNFKALLIKV